MSETIPIDTSLDDFYEAVPASAEFDGELASRDAARTVLDELGITYPDLGQQEIASYSGTGHSNGCDLDGE